MIRLPAMTYRERGSEPSVKYAIMTLSIVQPTAKLDATVHKAYTAAPDTATANVPGSCRTSTLSSATA